MCYLFVEPRRQLGWSPSEVGVRRVYVPAWCFPCQVGAQSRLWQLWSEQGRKHRLRWVCQRSQGKFNLIVCYLKIVCLKKIYGRNQFQSKYAIKMSPNKNGFYLCRKAVSTFYRFYWGYTILIRFGFWNWRSLLCFFLCSLIWAMIVSSSSRRLGRSSQAALHLWASRLLFHSSTLPSTLV